MKAKAPDAFDLLAKKDNLEVEKVGARLAEHWNEDIGDVLWWNFPVEEPPYCGTPLDEHFPKYKTHFTTIDIPNEIEKQKRWVVKDSKGKLIRELILNYTDSTFITTDNRGIDPLKFTDLDKAEAVAVLVDGSVEEV